MYKIIALDMDGTLLKSDNKISEKNKIAIKAAQAKGVKIVLASGRPLLGLNRYLEELDLVKGEDHVICFNGALVQNTKTKKIVSKVSLKGSDLKYIYEISKELNINIHAFSVKEGLIAPKNSLYTEYDANLNSIDINIKDFYEVNDEDDIIKIMMIDPQEILDPAIEKLPKGIFEKYSGFKSEPFYLEFTHKEVTKGLGLKKLCEHLGIKREEVIACGDGANDLSMVTYAGLGVAMGNAIPEVKEVANYITTSNNEDGIAKVIEKFILK